MLRKVEKLAEIYKPISEYKNDAADLQKFTWGANDKVYPVVMSPENKVHCMLPHFYHPEFGYLPATLQVLRQLTPKLIEVPRLDIYIYCTNTPISSAIPNVQVRKREITLRNCVAVLEVEPYCNNYQNIVVEDSIIYIQNLSLWPLRIMARRSLVAIYTGTMIKQDHNVYASPLCIDYSYESTFLISKPVYDGLGKALTSIFMQEYMLRTSLGLDIYLNPYSDDINISIINFSEINFGIGKITWPMYGYKFQKSLYLLNYQYKPMESGIMEWLGKHNINAYSRPIWHFPSLYAMVRPIGLVY